MIRLARSARTLIVLGFVAPAGFATLEAQHERSQSHEMKALAAEVRALRLTIERAAVNTIQAQLLLGRVQLQENRLATLGRRSLEVRAQFLDAQMAQAEVEHQLRQMANRLQSTTVLGERQAIEARIAELKNEIARHQVRTRQLRSDDAAAADALSTEQLRWSDFNDRLEALERTLGNAAVSPPR